MEKPRDGTWSNQEIGTAWRNQEMGHGETRRQEVEKPRKENWRDQ